MGPTSIPLKMTSLWEEREKKKKTEAVMILLGGTHKLSASQPAASKGHNSVPVRDGVHVMGLNGRPQVVAGEQRLLGHVYLALPHLEAARPPDDIPWP